MNRPARLTFLAILLVLFSLAALYYAFGYFTGREGKPDEWVLREEEPMIPVWPFTIPRRYEPLPVMGALALFYGVTALAAAVAIWRVHPWAFPLCVAWSVAILALSVGQQLYLEIYGGWGMFAVVLAAFVAFAFWLCGIVRQAVAPPAAPESPTDLQSPG
jgi:hypothetical protein